MQGKPTILSRENAARSLTGASAFTLIELLLVLALLAVVVSFSAPSLGKFFKGRTLDSEARRLLALTRMGQNRAVNEGVPMFLWLNVSKGTYGLEEEAGWEDADPRAVQFPLSAELKMELIRTNQVRVQTRFSLTDRTEANARESTGRSENGGLPGIRFYPDGTLGETSVTAVRLRDRDGASVCLAQTEYQLGYELRQETSR